MASDNPESRSRSIALPDASALGKPVLVRLPLVAPALALILGIAASTRLAVSAGAWVFSALLVLALAPLAARHMGPRSGTGALLAAILCIGGALGRGGIHGVDEHHVAGFVESSHLATLRGRVATVPEVITGRASWQEPQTSFLLETDGILAGKSFTRADGLVRVRVRGIASHIEAGMNVQVQGRIGRYWPADNPGQFDRLARARLDRVFVWCGVPAGEAVTTIPGDTWSPFRRWMGRLRALTRDRLSSADPEGGSLAQAMVVGHRAAGLARLNDIMRRSGAGHFMSISGLHLSVLLGLVYLLCRALTLGPRAGAAVVLVVLVAFLLVAQPRPGLLRSAIMASVLAIAVVSARPTSGLNALAAAAIIMLAIAPEQLLSPGFQMSFAIVAGLLLLMPPAKQLLMGRHLRRRGLRVFRDDQAIRRWLHMKGYERLGDYLCLSIVAYLVAAPLTAWHFGIFSPYAIVLSLLLFPLVVGVLVCGYLSLGLAWLAPNLSDRLAEASAAVARLLGDVVTSLEHLPALSVDLYPIPPWLIAAWLAVTAALLFAFAAGKQRGLAATAAAAVAAGVVWTQLPAVSPDTAQLHVLDVGAGQTTVLRIPSGPTILFDAGGPPGADTYRRVLRPFLLESKLPDPKAAFVSHANADHYTALLDLLDRDRIDTLYVSEHFARGDVDGGQAILLRRLADTGGKLMRLTAGDVIDLDDRTRVEVLWPPKEIPADLPRRENESSLVLRIRCDDAGVLLPGDAEEFTMESLLNRSDAPLPRCSAMLLPHHGSWDPLLPEIVRAVDPEIVLISRGRPPASAGAAGSFFRDLRAARRLLSTDSGGYLRLEFGYGALRATPWRRAGR